MISRLEEGDKNNISVIPIKIEIHISYIAATNAASITGHRTLLCRKATSYNMIMVAAAATADMMVFKFIALCRGKRKSNVKRRWWEDAEITTIPST